MTGLALALFLIFTAVAFVLTGGLFMVFYPDALRTVARPG
jgi:hypothetical protein